MKKRIAYIGLSYPLLYDYEHQAKMSENDLSDSPNPIIESPLGLMILYDELWFLCKSVCPNNMRSLPYVKFVDELYSDFYFEGAEIYMNEEFNTISIQQNLSFRDVIRLMRLETWKGLDSHTHSIQVGSLCTSASPSERYFLFDIYVFQALKQLYNENIELITNSRFALQPCNGGTEAEFVDRIIISDIPNYIGEDGPYHECMEELRENKYLKDFRHWIIETHNNLQRTEIDDMCISVKRNIEEVKENTFRKYLDDNSKLSFFKSTGTTIVKTSLGLLCSPISIVDAFTGSIDKGKEFLNAKNLRWQGFIMDSKDIIKNIT